MYLQQLYGKCFHIQTAERTGFFRVVFVDQGLDQLGLFELKVKVSGTSEKTLRLVRSEAAVQPFPMSLADFLSVSGVHRQEVVVDLPTTCAKPSGELKEAQLVKFRLIKSIMEDATRSTLLRRVLMGGGHCTALGQIASEVGRNLTTIARMASRFYMCDCDAHKAAMCWMFGWGERKPPIVNPSVRRGRPPDEVRKEHSDPPSVTLMPPHKEVVHFFVKSLKRTERNELTDTAFLKKLKNHAARVAAGNISAESKTYRDLEHLTIDQFQRLLEKIDGSIARRTNRIGQRKMTKDERALYGDAKHLIEFSGQLYLIDATVADVYLVSAIDRRLIIGRPTIYLVIDAFSSMILAVHITLRPACLDEAMNALYRAMAPKDLFFDMLDLPDDVRQFLPQGCKALEIFADRGEMLSEGAVETFGRNRISLAIAAAYRGDAKSLVERQFGVANQNVIHWLPGAVRSRQRERGAHDSRLDAALSVNGLTRILWYWAAEQNATKDMSRHISATMVTRDVEATPMGFWEYGLEVLHGSPKYLTREEAIKQFVQPVDANCNRGGYFPVAGTLLEKHRFTEKWMRDDDEFFDEIGTRVKLYPDPDRPLNGFVWSRRTSKMREVALIDTKKDYKEEDISVYDVVDMDAYLKLRASELANNATPLKRGFSVACEEIVEREVAATKAALEGDVRSKAKRVSDIKVNKRNAIAAATAPPVAIPTDTTSVVTQPRKTPLAQSTENDEQMGWLAALSEALGE